MNLSIVKQRWRYSVMGNATVSIKLFYSLRILLFGLLSAYGLGFKSPDMEFLNSYIWSLPLIVFGSIGLIGVLMDVYIMKIVFASSAIFFFGVLGYSSCFHGLPLVGINFLFDMAVMIWLVFRLQHDHSKRIHL